VRVGILLLIQLYVKVGILLLTQLHCIYESWY
jgi:hypothetical protein